jgi:hypothetical protein
MPTRGNPRPWAPGPPRRRRRGNERHVTPRRTPSATVLAPAAWAQSEQACTTAQLAPVDAWLARHPWRIGKASPDARVDAACKASPADKAVTIVAAAYDRGTDHDKNVVVALVEPRDGKVRSILAGVIEEDAGMRVMHGSLRVDTARYDLAPGVRAFGVDVSSQASGPKCAESGTGPLRTLFVQDGASLRPVLASVVLSSWLLVSGPASPGAERKDDAVIEDTATTISVAPHATRGFADLVLASTIDGRPAPRRRLVLRYDRTRYGSKDDSLWPDVILPEPATNR